MPIDPRQVKAMGHEGAQALGASAGGSSMARPSPLSAGGTAQAPMTPDRRQQQAQLLMQQEEAQPAPSAPVGMGMPPEQMAQLRDRITKTLMDATKEMTPLDTFAQTGRAAAQAATGEVTFGDALNAMNAQREAAARQMMQVLQGERQLQLAEEEGKRSAQRLAHDIKNSDRAYSLEERRFAHAVETADRGYDLQVRQFAEQVLNNKRNYNLATQQLAQQVLNDERNWTLGQEELKVKQAAEQRAQVEALAKQGNANAAAVTNAISALPEEIRDVYFAELADLPYDVDASNVNRAIGEVRRKLAAAGDLPPIDTDASAAEEKVRRTMEAYPGISRAEAIKVADGILRVVTDPQSGLHTVVDPMTGRGRLVQTPLPQAGQPQSPPPGETLADIANQGDVAGLIPGAIAFWNKTLGQVPGFPVAEEVEAARQVFRAEQGNLIRALSINPKYPVAEMNRIREEMKIEPGTFDSREALLSRMAGIRQSLERRLANEERAAQDISLPIQARQNAQQAANDIKNFLSVLGNPRAALQMGKGGVVPQGSGLTAEDDALINRYLGGQ